MYIKIKFFKSSGKLYTEETIFPGMPEPPAWDNEKIQELIEKHFPDRVMSYVFEAIDDHNKLYSCRLVKH